MIKILSSIICFFCIVIYNSVDYFNNFFFFLPNLPESFITEEKWEKTLRELIKKVLPDCNNLKSATKWNTRNRPCMSAVDVCRWMAFGIMIATIVVGCTIVIGPIRMVREKQNGE